MGRKTAMVGWRNLMLDTGMKCDFLKTFHRFEDVYGESHRHYHTLDHIDTCLGEFLLARGLAEDPRAVQIAIWFHDVVYDTHQRDNEKRSANYAYEFCLRVGLEQYASPVYDLVRATDHSAERIYVSQDAALLIDVDLSIFGKKPPVFDHYEHQIRREYDWVPKEDFRRSRARIIEPFVARPSIYHTDFFRDRYEKQAQENLTRSLEQLLVLE